MSRSATDGTRTASGSAPGVKRRLIFLLPLGVFAGFAVAFLIGLGMNPQDIPSALIGKPVPAFKLPPVKGRRLGFSSLDLKGQVSLVNVFASWCTACKAEHPILMGLKARNLVPIYGLNYKDKPADASKWLDTLGDPYTRTGADLNGRVAIDWGVYGVPESFVVDRQGRIVFKKIGPITRDELEKNILPLIRKLQQSGG